MTYEAQEGSASRSQVPEWLRTFAAGNSRFAALLGGLNQNFVDGYHYTLREICQQPPTWSETARRLKDSRVAIQHSLEGCERILITGSGSSQYAGECVAPALRNDLNVPVDVQGGGELLLCPKASVAGERTLMISLARSGNSPESAACVRALLEAEPCTRHLILTCNSNGKLARDFANDSRVQVVSLSEEVHDRSLVMTSSFTNLALSARFVGWVNRADEFVALADRLDFAARRLLMAWPDRLGAFVSGSVKRMVFLGGGCRYGAAREASLKMLEMTDGKVATMAETYLGLRHGPMCFLNDQTVVVCFLSSDPLIRAYERDLILELDAKKLGARKLVVGLEDPGQGLCKGSDLAISYELPSRGAGDADLALLDVMVAQILGFHRCRQEGLQPDSPSEKSVISRVVTDFQIHGAQEAVR